MNTGPAPGLSVRGLTVRADGQTLLDAVSLEVAPGSRCAVVGPNGAGKSTLLRACLRLLAGAEGDLRLGGRPLPTIPRRELARLLAYVPQAGPQDAPFTVRDFVRMGRYPHLSAFGVFSREDLRAADQALDLTGLAGFELRALDTLSGGERQKAYLAAALAQGGRVLLLDEPTAFLDPLQQVQVYAVLERLHRELGLTLVEVTHDVNRAALDHDQVIGLRAGRKVFDGTPDELMRPGPLETIYGRAFTLAPHPVSGRTVAWPEVRP
jgi:iron complex transport system ATP-binding protein